MADEEEEPRCKVVYVDLPEGATEETNWIKRAGKCQGNKCLYSFLYCKSLLGVSNMAYDTELIHSLLLLASHHRISLLQSPIRTVVTHSKVRNVTRKNR